MTLDSRIFESLLLGFCFDFWFFSKDANQKKKMAENTGKVEGCFHGCRKCLGPMDEPLKCDKTHNSSVKSVAKYDNFQIK